jgi:hypothetical protein
MDAAPWAGADLEAGFAFELKQQGDFFEDFG